MKVTSLETTIVSVPYRHREVSSRVQRDGVCWVGGTTWHGRAAMRISICNWSTTDADIDRSAESIARAATSEM